MIAGLRAGACHRLVELRRPDRTEWLRFEAVPGSRWRSEAAAQWLDMVEAAAAAAGQGACQILELLLNELRRQTNSE